MENLLELRSRFANLEPEDGIFDLLMTAEMLVLDPEFTNKYIEFTNTPGVEVSELMRADVDFANKLENFRERGFASEPEVLRTRAQSLLGLSQIEVWKAAQDYYDEFKRIYSSATS